MVTKHRGLWCFPVVLVTLALVMAGCQAAAPAEPGEPTTVKGQVTTTPAPSTPSTADGATTAAQPAAEPGGPKYGGTLTVASSVDPLDFDQAYKTAWQSWTLDITNENMVDPDWTKGPAGTKELLLQAYPWYPKSYLTGALLEDWELETPTKWVLHVRQGVRFHDKPPVNGREMTAEDVAVSINRMLTLPGSWLSLVINKPAVTVIDKRTVQLDFETFDVSWEYRLFDTVFVVAKESVLDAAGKETENLRNWENSLGTGAWQLDDWVKGSSLTFKRFKNYWAYDPFHPENRLPYIDSITTLIMPDASTRLAALRTGKIDVLGVSLQDAPSLIQTNKDLRYIEMVANYSLEMAMRTELEPLSDQKVRQALSMAVNRDVIVGDLFKGHAMYLNRFFNPNDVALYVPYEELPDNLRELFTYDPDKAKKMLAEAGYPNGFNTSVLLSSTDSTAIEVATLIKSDWAKIGVNLELDPRESAVATSIRYGRTFPGFNLSGYGNAFAWTCPDVFSSGHYSNWSGVSDPWWDQKRAEVVGISDEAARNEVATDMNFYSLEHMWVIPLPTPNSYLFWWPWVKQWEGSSMSGTYHYYRPYRLAWIDQDLKFQLVGKR